MLGTECWFLCKGRVLTLDPQTVLLTAMMVVVFLLFPFQQSHSAQTGFKLTAISPQPPRCWDCRRELLHPAGVLIVEDSSLIFGPFLAPISPISSFPLNMST